MCVTLTESLSKRCSCKFAHLCDRRRSLEIVQKKLEMELSLQGAFNKLISPLAFTFAKVKNLLMQKKAILFDLDNTIYPVHSIREELFAPLYKIIEDDGSHKQDIEKIKDDLTRRPFQLVAKDYQFLDELTEKGEALLKGLTYNGKIQPFEDYRFVKELSADKFLVTTGFLKLQQSKIEGMKITQDFKEIHIVDPSTSDRTKKDVFAEIMKRHHYKTSEVLVIGDDLQSEIKAAQQLGIEAILYDYFKQNTSVNNIITIENFSALKQFI